MVSIKTRYRICMYRNSIKKTTWVLAVLVFVAACSGGKPYVYVPNEFNRASVSFGKSVKDRDNVTICYAKGATTPNEINALAKNECSKFGKTAIPSKQSLAICPASTPIAAVYSCQPNKTASPYDLFSSFPLLLDNKQNK